VELIHQSVPSFVRYHVFKTDYEGVINLWDSNTGVTVQSHDEHEKRAWSVDFSTLNPTVFASCGDDTKIKLWATNQQKSTLTIGLKANGRIS
jgi:WD40 repeat protein